MHFEEDSPTKPSVTAFVFAIFGTLKTCCLSNAAMGCDVNQVSDCIMRFFATFNRLCASALPDITSENLTAKEVGRRIKSQILLYEFPHQAKKEIESPLQTNLSMIQWDAELLMLFLPLFSGLRYILTGKTLQ